MEFLNHLWQSATILSMFYLVYVLLLRKDTLFEAKRHFFLIGILVALFFPFIEITQTVYLEAPVFERTSLPSDIIPMTSNTTAVVPLEQGIDWTLILTSIYLLGIVVLLTRLIIQCASLFKLIRSYPIEKKGKYRFVMVEDTVSPFSFFRYIVYNPSLHTQEELEMILQHEKVHVSQWHSLDILLGNLIQVLQWANPFSWFYRRSMEENLEFIADGKTVNRVSSKTQYQLTMVKASSAWAAPSLTIQFYQSFIKKRIVMLNKQHSKKRNALKAIIILPLLALFLWSFQVKEVIEYQEPEIQETETLEERETTSEEPETMVLASPETEPVLASESSTNQETEIISEKRTPLSSTELGDNPLYILNGKEIRKKEFPEDNEIAIEGKLQVFYPKEAVEIYGAKGNQGVVVLEGNLSHGPTHNSAATASKVAQFRYRIHKNSTDEELRRMKDELRKEHGIDLSYTTVRNGRGEITSINMSYSGNKRNGSYSITEDDDTAIEEFEFYMLDDGETGFYSEAHRLRREERMKARLAEVEERKLERLAERESQLKNRMKEREQRLADRNVEMRVRNEEMQERREEMEEREIELREHMRERSREVEERRAEMMEKSESLARVAEREYAYVNGDHDNFVIITKNTSDAQLEEMKSNLKAKGVSLSYKKVKRNSRGEITSIKINVKDSKGRSQTSIRSDTEKAIEDVIIEY
ncbi:MAG: hypothetical protein Aureis2KO_21270 [Aureisphaera sp.]